MTDIKEHINYKKLHYLIERLNLEFPVAELSRKTGYSDATISPYVSGKVKASTKFLQKICEVYAIDFESLDSINKLSEPQSEYKIEPNIEAIAVDFKEMTTMYVPLVNQYAYGGYMNGFGDLEYIDSLPKIPFSADQEHRGEYLCFEVKGDSMDDGTVDAILERDILLCRNIRKDYWKSKLHINKWDFVIVHREKGIVVKRIIKHDVELGLLTLHSLNEEYEDFEVHLKDVAQILNIVDIKRNRKR